MEAHKTCVRVTSTGVCDGGDGGGPLPWAQSSVKHLWSWRSKAFSLLLETASVRAETALSLGRLGESG